MSRQLEQTIEERVDRERKAVLEALYGGLSRAVSRSGGELVGLSAKGWDAECLVVLKAVFPAGQMVCFVGSTSFPEALSKALREAQGEKLRWREDVYRGPS
jgi:hypothetical protein